MNIYGDAETERWFVDSYRATGKRLDMGKSRKLEDLPLDLVGRPHPRRRVDTDLRGGSPSKRR